MDELIVKIMSPETLKEKFPDVFKAVESAGYAEGHDEGAKAGHNAGYAQGKLDGAENERKRIKEVSAQAYKGHEALVEQLMFDGKTAGPDAAVQILAAEKAKAQVRAEEIKKHSVPPVPPSNTDNQQAGTQASKDLPVAERAKAEWEKSAEIRSEFTSFDAYLAYQKAVDGGRVKILRK